MSATNKARDRGPDGKLLRKYKCVRYHVHFPDGAPKWWRKLYMTRPRRRESDRLCRDVMRGIDLDRMVWPLGNSKPHVYYW